MFLNGESNLKKELKIWVAKKEICFEDKVYILFICKTGFIYLNYFPIFC